MRLRDILIEAPLADYQTYSGPDTDFDPKRKDEPGNWPTRDSEPKKDTFSRLDRHLITRPETQQVLTKWLKTSALNFYLFFVNDPSTVANITGPEYEMLPDAAQTATAGMSNITMFYGPVDDETARQFIIRHYLSAVDRGTLQKALSDPKGVVVVHRHNDDEEGFNGTTVPMTPAIILHRTVHSLISVATHGGGMSGYAEGMADLVDGLYYALEEIGVRDSTALMVRSFFTFGSARNGKVSRAEIPVELVVQYLIRGKITLKLPTKPSPWGAPEDKNVLNTSYGVSPAAEEKLAVLVKNTEARMNRETSSLVNNNLLTGFYVV